VEIRMTIRIDIGEDLERQMTGLVSRGRYDSETDLVRSAVQLLIDKEEKLAAFDAAIQLGLDDIEAGRTTPAGDVFVGLRAKYR
jgi:antitoxin ParD1/3/4